MMIRIGLVFQMTSPSRARKPTSHSAGSRAVDEQQHDEPDSEPPAADPDVHRGRNEHREEELELEQDDAELGEKRADRGDRRPKPPEEPTPVEALRLDRLVLAPLLWVLLNVKHCANRYRLYSDPPEVRESYCHVTVA